MDDRNVLGLARARGDDRAPMDSARGFYRCFFRRLCPTMFGRNLFGADRDNVSFRLLGNELRALWTLKRTPFFFFQKGTPLAPGICRPKQSRRRQRCGRLLAQTKTVWGTPTLPHAGQAGGHLGVRLGYRGVRPTSVAGSTPIVARLHLASLNRELAARAASSTKICRPQPQAFTWKQRIPRPRRLAVRLSATRPARPSALAGRRGRRRSRIAPRYIARR